MKFVLLYELSQTLSFPAPPSVTNTTVNNYKKYCSYSSSYSLITVVIVTVKGENQFTRLLFWPLSHDPDLFLPVTGPLM